MYPCTCALIFAVMKPSSVATPSFKTGTSFGMTVVTRTSGAGGATCSALREQPLVIPSSRAAVMRSVLVRTFILFNPSSLSAYRTKVVRVFSQKQARRWLLSYGVSPALAVDPSRCRAGTRHPYLHQDSRV